MAEMKKINTRIKLRIDTLENWKSSSLQILPGEVCFATVAAGAGTGLEEPVVMMKVGTEEGKTFDELPWAFHAKASDVLAACKTEAGLTKFVQDVLAGEGIASDEVVSALADRVTVVEGDLNTATTGLKARMTAVEGKAAANETAIGTLNGLVGDTKVATQISNAITALNLGDTYAAKVHTHEIADVNGLSDSIAAAKKAGTDANAALEAYKTLNDAAVKVNSDAIAAIKDSETIDSFADVVAELAKKQNTGNYSVEGHKHEIADVNGLESAIADAKKAGTDAASAAAQALVDAKAHTDGELDRLVGDETVGAQISSAITELDLDNTYAAKEHEHTKADITDFAHTHEMSEVNGLATELAKYQLKGDYATKAEAQGYADAKDTAIAAAKKAGDDAQAEVDALELLVGTLPEGKTSVVAYIEEKTAGIATDAALGELQAKVTQAEKDIDAIEADYLKAADKTELQGAIDAIEADYLKAADKTELQGAIDVLEGLVGEKSVAEQVAAEAELREEADAALDGRVKAIEDDYLKAADKEALQTQINTIMSNPDAEGAINSINEFTQYVKDHGTIAEGMRTDINANATAIEAIEKDYLKAADKTELAGKITAEENRAKGVENGLDTRLQAVETAVGESGSVAGDIADALAEAKGYTDTEVQELADGAVATNAAAIATLNGLVGDKKVSEQISAVTNPLAERVVELEKVDHSHANATELAKFVDGDKAKLDSALQSVTAAAGSGLKATQTGTGVAIAFDESVTFIFDCGTSAE